LSDAEQTAAGQHSPEGAGYWFACALAVFVKDVRTELRTRYALGTVALFAITTLVMVSAALSTAVPRADVSAAMLWVILLFAALSGLARVFIREEEMGTANGLRLGAPATAVYAGKLLFNLALVATVEAISIPLFLAFLPVKIWNPGLFAGILIVGAVALAAAATFIAALIAQASSGKAALFTVVAFPVLLPLLFLCVQATYGAFNPIASYQARGVSNVGMMGVYAVVMTTASFLLFEYVWHD
jgi:heme exporter protein B